MRRLSRALGVLVSVAAVLLGLGFRADRPAAAVEGRRALAPSRFVDASGLRVHVRDRGDGPAVVLLHGSNSSLFTWEGWTRTLARDHRVVAFDLPGHGLTGPDPLGRYDAAQMASFVDDVTRALGLGRFTLVGNSMGGNVAWHYALAHPEHVERLVLVDAAGLPRDEPPVFAMRVFAHPVFGRVARWVTPRFLIRRSVLDVYAEPSRVTDAAVDLYEDLLLREGNREATRLRRRRSMTDGAEARLGELRVPTLVLWGARDRWILPKYGERFHARIPGSSLVVLPNLGHVPMEEDPDASVLPVVGFLRRGSDRR